LIIEYLPKAKDEFFAKPFTENRNRQKIEKLSSSYARRFFQKSVYYLIWIYEERKKRGLPISKTAIFSYDLLSDTVTHIKLIRDKSGQPTLMMSKPKLDLTVSVSINKDNFIYYSSKNKKIKYPLELFASYYPSIMEPLKKLMTSSSKRLELLLSADERLFFSSLDKYPQYKNFPFGYPIKFKAYISSPYGNRKNRQTKETEFHKGADFGVLTGQEVISTINNGVVVIANENKDCAAGKYVDIALIDPKLMPYKEQSWHAKGLRLALSRDHQRDYTLKKHAKNAVVYIRLLHLSQINVKLGQIVKYGTVIGKSGKSGNTRGGPHAGEGNVPCLHYEIIIVKNGKVFNIDPQTMLVDSTENKHLQFIEYVRPLK